MTDVFPYGKVTLSDEFVSRTEVDNYADDYELPREFPVRHPALEAIKGTYSMNKPLPDYWRYAIESASTPMRFFLMSVTAEEYYSGIANEKRYKLFRSMLSEEEKRQVPQSPKLGSLLQGNSYYNHFTSRGSTGATLEVHITTNPEDIFYMSNGDGWNSCQHFSRGGYRERLRGNMFDCNLAMAYVLSPGKEHVYDRNSILARCLLRVGTLPGVDDSPYIMIDRDYGNDQGTQENLVKTLVPHIESKGYKVGKLGTRRWLDLEKSCTAITPVCYKPRRWEWGYHDNMSQYVENVTHDGQFEAGVFYGPIAVRGEE